MRFRNSLRISLRPGSKADSARGSFRAYLLTALRHFVARQLEGQSAQKRGRAIAHDGLEVAGDLAASEDEMPETVFHREWATVALNQALGVLRAEAEAAGKLSLFERVSSFMAEDADRDEYQRIAADLGVRPNTIAVAVFRLRERFRVLVRREVAQTVDSRAIWPRNWPDSASRSAYDLHVVECL